MKGKEVKKIVLNLEPPPKRKKNSFRLLALGISLLLSTSAWLQEICYDKKYIQVEVHLERVLYVQMKFIYFSIDLEVYIR